MRKKVIVSVINDLATDQRVNKVCTSLHNMGFDVSLVGRVMKKSLPLKERIYKTHRMRLIFEKGPLFYAEYNIRLFLYLLFHKHDLLVSNDLDTLLANHLVSKLKGTAVVYDSHEYYTETPELVNRKIVQKVWKKIEGWLFPKIDDVFTVSQNIAELFKKQYGKEVKVVRNVPPRRKHKALKSKEELGMPTDRKIIILQGAGINIDRGTEELTQAMQYVNDAVLYIVGSGDVIEIIKEMVSRLKLEDKVVMTGKVPFEELVNYTVHADLGLSLDKDSNINYRYSLPNRLFDYIQAGVPVLTSKLVEIQRIVEHYNIGSFIESHEPQHIADRLNSILSDQQQLNEWKNNLQLAAEELNWDLEEEVLKEVYQKYV